MGWIKRNLLFVISGLLALGLLGAAGFYIYQGFSRNAEASGKLNDIYGRLQDIQKSPLQPGNEQTNNTEIAKEQEKQVRKWINGVVGRFQPVASIPQGEVTSKTYATALGTTIYQLQQEARDNNVGLPPNYNFSFQVQSSKLTISSGLAPLAKQLGEVKTISELLFSARVNDLEGIQRVRVSDDDTSGGLQGDYTDLQPVTNELAIFTPYMVTFRSFTPEIAKVIANFANATNFFIVKSVSVEPAATTDNGTSGEPGTPGMPGMMGMPGMPQPTGRGGLQTVLKEQLLRVNLEVDIVALLPKS